MNELTAALIIQEKELLLVSNIKEGLRVEPPGGKRRHGEGLETCVVREAGEELGIEIEPIRLLGTYPTDSPEGQFDVHMFLSRITRGTPHIREKEKFSGFDWYTFARIQELQQRGVLVPNMCLALEDLRDYL